MDEKESFTIGDWFESKPEYFDLEQEVHDGLNVHLTALYDYCRKHNVPMVVMAVTEDTKTEYRFEGRSVMPLARCNATILAAEAVMALGIQSEEAAEFLDTICEADIERQQRENFPPLKLVH